METICYDIDDKKHRITVVIISTYMEIFRELDNRQTIRK